VPFIENLKNKLLELSDLTGQTGPPYRCGDPNWAEGTL
jgi:hypothetical protein